MSRYLFALGGFSYRRRWWVLGTWLAVLVGIGIAFVGLRGRAQPTTSAFPARSRSAPSSSCSRAARLQRRADPDHLRRPGAACDHRSGSCGRHRPVPGEPDRRFPISPPPRGPARPGSSHRTAASGLAPCSGRAAPGEVSDAALEGLESAMAPAQTAGVQVEYSGSVFPGYKVAVPHLPEIIGIGAAFLILLVTFGAVVAAGLPILTAGIGVGIGALGIFVVAAFVDIPSAVAVPGVDARAVLRHRLRAVHPQPVPKQPAAAQVSRGVDRACRGNRRQRSRFRGADRHHRAVRPVDRRHPVPDLHGPRRRGVRADRDADLADPAARVARLRRLQGRRSSSGPRCNPAAPRRSPRSPHTRRERTMGAAWARFVVRFRKPLLLGGSAALIVIGLPALGLHLGLPSGASQPESNTSRQAYDLTAENLGRRVQRPTARRRRPGQGHRSERPGHHRVQPRPGTRRVGGRAGGRRERHGDHPGHPADRTQRHRDRRPGQTHPCRPRRHRGQHRSHHPGRRHHGVQHRHLGQAGRRAAGLPGRGRRSGVRPADGRLPRCTGATHVDRRLPALGVRRPRRSGGGLPMGLGRGPSRHHAGRDHQLPADHRAGDHLRAVQRLRGVRGVPDQGGVRGTPTTRWPPCATGSGCRPGSSPPRH